MEQHILCRQTEPGEDRLTPGDGGCKRGTWSLANATSEADPAYLSGFYGKWHSGSLSNTSGSGDCYEVDGSVDCLEGYMRFGSDAKGGRASCCQGADGLSWPGNPSFTNKALGISHPLHFGFSEFVATPQCGASSTTNCGCFFWPEPHNSSACNLGHYHDGQQGKTHPNNLFTECSQYYVGNASTGEVRPMTLVSGVDDQAFLVDRFESLLLRAVAQERPFLATLFFHGVHIPYIATPESRAKYAARGMDLNEQDYWGTINQIDTAVGRVRGLLKQHGLTGSTWVSITADNGPEVSPQGGQGTGMYLNPGRTGGLRGRKRDCTEGGTRVIGLVEYPPAVSANREEKAFPIITSDILATVADILNVTAPMALDGISLLPVLRGEQAERPTAAGMGIHGSFPFGDTNRPVQRCPMGDAASRLGDVPEGFSTSGRGSGQFSWAEGNHMKIFGCDGICNGKNHSCKDPVTGVPHAANLGWRFFLYNLTADRAETTDLWESQRPLAQQMFARFQRWQWEVRESQGDGELGCNALPNRPGPKAAPASKTDDGDATATAPAPVFDSCPDQQANRLITAEQFGSIYSSATEVGVKFQTSDATLQAVYDHAVSCEEKNTKDFLPGLNSVEEGSGYKNVWLETQPMAGAMWSVRNLTNALANQLVFMRTQRNDGRLPGMVTTNNSAGAVDPVLTAVYCFHPKGKQTGGESLLQGDYFSSTSVDVAFFLNISDESTAKAYVTELHGVLERFDDWMWRSRRSSLPNMSDVLWTPSSSDWGGDGYDGYRGLPAPFLSMDMMAYASSNALALVRTSLILGNASGAAHWTARQASVAASLKRALWIDEKGACYDVDGNGKVVDVLVHNNLRAMWHSAYSQEMADAFVARHLRNTSEFWTAFPLPSIAANDPKFVHGIPRNSWSGPAEGLTYQRAIRALENYGYHSEITVLAGKLMDAIASTPGYRFPQQWNPQAYSGTPAAAPGPGDCYGPALLSLLEYNTYAHGIKPRPADGVLLWSDSIVPGRKAATSTYMQTLGANTFSLAASAVQGTYSGTRDGKELFTATRGVRVLTNLAGVVVGVVGISTTPVEMSLSIEGATTTGKVEPNSEYKLDGKGGLKLARQVPFAPLKADK